ncbi:MAG: threonylcarbamoyl-AMP synthase [Lachnospiraceae bacterium]|nr:threonylcarbamoyl-AMP synthase [Lachnospiraceae bacterium]
MKTVTAMIKDKMDQKVIEEAGSILKRGGLVAFPTETVYGLGGNALDEQAAEKIYAAKGRPSDNPLIVHIAEFGALEQIAAEIPKEVKKLADAFWPGPLTMIFRKTDKVPKGTTGGLDTVAVRMPDHPVALALIRAAGGYVAAPSANLSGRPSPTCAAHVQEDLDGRIEMILDGGDVGIGLESTIVDLSEGTPTILRPGYINQQMLENVIGKTEIDRAILSDDSGIKPKAPGMKYRHYAPKASLTIIEGAQDKVIRRINELLEEGEKKGERIGVIASAESAACYQGGVVRTIGSRSDELSISRHLFGILRDFDTLAVDRIYSESFETPQMGQAIMNRLMKAAGHQVLEV